jgi:hypothetical protein
MGKNMKFSILFALLSLLVALPAFGHGTFRVELVPVDENATYGPGAFDLYFHLIDNDLEQFVLPAQVGTEKLPLLIYDSKLASLGSAEAHFMGEFWHARIELPYMTRYWVWAEGKLLADGAAFLGGGAVDVAGAPMPPVAPLADLYSAEDRGSLIELAPGTITVGRPAELSFKFSHADGSPARIACASMATPCADLYIATSDGDGLFHAVAAQAVAGGPFVATFKAPGRGKYRVWTSFTDGGAPRLAPLGLTAVR